MKLSIVIPSYNEAANIACTLTELATRLKGVAEQHEIIVVDDHSGDGTLEAAATVRGVNVRCIRLSRRSGSHIAIRMGLAAATGDAVLCISADGQDDPAVLAAMMAKWRAGSQIIWALRHDRKQEPWRIRVLAQAFYKLLVYFNRPQNPGLDLSRADFYLLDRRVVDSLLACRERFTSLFGLIAWMGFQQDCVEYERRPRRHGASKWDFRQRVALALDWIIAFSWLPLRVSAALGVTLALLGVAYALFIIANAILGTPAEGWSSVMVSVLILSGVQLILLGAIGEYVGRGLDESRRRPIAFVEKEVSVDEQSGTTRVLGYGDRLRDLELVGGNRYQERGAS